MEVFTEEQILRGFQIWNEIAKNNPEEYSAVNDNSEEFAKAQTKELLDCIKETEQ